MRRYCYDTSQGKECKNLVKMVCMGGKKVTGNTSDESKF